MFGLILKKSRIRTSCRLILALLFGLWLSDSAQSTELKIKSGPGPVQLTLEGEAGAGYRLEGTSDPADPNRWELLLGLTLTNDLHEWFDSSSLRGQKRFYRAIRLPAPDSPPPANDFRLTDHRGRSHELFYHTDSAAIVLIFAGPDCSALAGRVADINRLADQFSSRGVVFWMVAASAPTNRPALAAQAAHLGIELPILEDQDNLVAHNFQAQALPEAVAIDPESWTVFYQGAIDDRLDAAVLPSTQLYLENALETFLQKQPVSPYRTQPAGCPVEAPAPRTFSYAQEIAPILQDKCARCHSAGNIAPWAMTNYTSVQAYAGSIKNEILANRMPPWHADAAYGAFINDFSLPPPQKRALIQWIDQGAPRGDGPDPLLQLPPPPPEWPLGTPTIVLSIPKQSLPATGVINYRYIDIPTSFGTDVWLSAAVVRPGNRRVVHHCLVYFGSASFLMGLDGFFAGFVPGQDPAFYPPGTGKLIPKGTVLRFQMHYITTGQPESDQTQLGLYFSPVPPARALQTKSTFNIPFVLRQLSIPPGDADFEMTAEYEFSNEKDVLLYEMSPHMHLRGSRFQYEAVYPDNTRETLLSVPHYDFSWQTLYRLAEPKRLPAGTKLFLTAAFDNSPLNLSNPNPDVAVNFGEQTFNEMMIGYFNFSEVP